MTDAAGPRRIGSTLERALAQSSPAGFAQVTSNGRWRMARHLSLVNDALVRVARGEINRVIINMPPRHGKSELISTNLPPWYLGLFPDRRILLASYEADFAAQWGRKSRALINAYGGLFESPVAVDPESSSASRWDILGHRGGMQTAGVGGPITGKGADLAIIDDPIKNAEEASSQTIRDAQWDWYQSTLYTRLEPEGAILLVMTRWNEDDLAGRLIEEMKNGGDQWEVISLPGLAEEEDILGREPGQALWPSRFSSTRLHEIERTLGPYWFAGLYQQRPAPLEGGLFKRSWFEIVDAAPARCMTLRQWDLAASEGKNDWTSGLKLGIRDGVTYVMDIQRAQKDPAGVEQLVSSTAAMDGRETAIRIEQEPGSSGKSVISHYARHVLVGYDFLGDRSTGSKVERARPVAAAAELGNVKIVRGSWNSVFLSELSVFPNGKNDDQVDTLSGAFNNLTALYGGRGDEATQDDALGEQIAIEEPLVMSWEDDIPGM
jgi:predicted phage terminase large subunit-like protein